MRSDYGLFSYWSDGNHHHEVHPDPPEPSGSKPFHVVIEGTSYIPLSALVFARDAEHAWARVTAAIELCWKMMNVRAATNPYEYGGEVMPSMDYMRCKSLREKLANGEYKYSVRPFDVTRISCNVNWASNGGVF